MTNTFGGSPFRLKLHNLHGQVFELTRAAGIQSVVRIGDCLAPGAMPTWFVPPSSPTIVPIAEQTRERILTAAVAEFGAKGYAGARTAGIRRCCRTGHGRGCWPR